MTTTHRRPAQLGLAVFAALAALLAIAAPARGAEPGTTTNPRELALDWLRDELAAHDGLLTVSFGTDVFPDQGLTIDAILAEVAGGRGDDPVVADSVDALDAVLEGYIGSAGESYAGATAKALFLQEVLGQDLGGPTDLDAVLRARIQTSGDQQGRFSDASAFGDFSNGISQALAVLALDRTSGGVPADGLSFLLDQQCADGSFRLTFGSTAACASSSEGDADATAFALSALLTQPSSPAVEDAVTEAVAHLLSAQQTNGGYVGTGAVNSNTTGLVGAALRAAGEDEAADDAAAFVASLQVVDCADEDVGAIAYDRAAFDAGIAADRSQWTRASAQGVLGLGLPAYGDIGTLAPVDAGLVDVACSALPVDGPTVTPSPAGPASPSADREPLPATGSRSGELAGLGLALVAIGAASVAAGRRRGADRMG